LGSQRCVLTVGTFSGSWTHRTAVRTWLANINHHGSAPMSQDVADVRARAAIYALRPLDQPDPEHSLGHRGREDDSDNAGFQEPANLDADLDLDLYQGLAENLRDRLAALDATTWCAE
jgi:hypothetical protein